MTTIVIGGGLVGVTTLYELCRRGEDVLLIEQNDEVAKEASHANGGLLTASMSDPWNGPGVGSHLLASVCDPSSAMKLRLHAIPSLVGWGIRFLRNSSPLRHRAATLDNFKLAQYSVSLTKSLIRELDIRCASNALGTIKIFESKAAFATSMAIADILRPLGLAFEALSPDEAVEREPELRHVKRRISCALYFPDDAWGEARLFTQELATRAVSLGGKIRTNLRVRRILANSGVVCGVATDKGVIKGARVVVAAANASPGLVRPFGINLPIKPAKGYSLTVDASGWSDRPQLPVIDDALHAAVTPFGDALRIAGTAEFTGDDLSIPQERVHNLFLLFDRLYPHLSHSVNRKTTTAWAGLRPMSADGRPFIGPGPEGLWINTGHGHLGWTFAMGSARLLADQMCDVKPAIDPHPFRSNRYSTAL